MWKKHKKNKKVDNPFTTEEVKVFKQFKKQKIFNQFSFVFLAAIVALWVNMFVLNGDYWDNLKVNILESQQQVQDNSDVYIENLWEEKSNILVVKSGKQMDSVMSLSLGIIYNPEIVEIQDVFSKINWLELQRIENEAWVSTLLLTFDSPQNIENWKDILNFYLSKNTETTQHINIINSNFTDSLWNDYQLSTSWIAF